jgi:hypothetical protein
MTKKILFINSKLKKCGVYQYGLRLFEILKKTESIEYIYKEMINQEEYNSLLIEEYDLILYNYHSYLWNWLNETNIQTKVKNIGLQHDLEENNIFDVTLRLDTTLEERYNRYNIPRPIFENIDKLLKNHTPSKNIEDFINYSEPDTPIFGSFGFGFKRKRFDIIIKLINDTYDKAIIKLVLPHADTMPSEINMNELLKITKPGIKIMCIHDFLDEKDLLLFLKKNSMNIFTYESHPCAGVSSVIDYALSVDTPLSISDASWFRHIYSDDICVYKNNIKNIMLTSKTHCDKYREIFSNNNLRNKISSIIEQNTKKRVAILYSGQIRTNGLSSYTEDNIILDSIQKHFINDEFKNTYEYDVFISTDTIDIEKANCFFGHHLKNINFTEKSYFINKIDETIPNYHYFYNKYLMTNFNGSMQHLHALFQYYRMFCAYKMAKDYEKKNNIEYDIFIRIRPDSRIMQDMNKLFNIVVNENKLIMEHEQICIVNKKFQEIFKLIDYYGNYTNSPIENPKRYKFLTKDGKYAPNHIMCFAPEKLFVDHVVYILEKNNATINNLLGLVYSSYNLLYRGNNEYGHYNEDINRWKPYSSLDNPLSKLLYPDVYIEI